MVAVTLADVLLTRAAAQPETVAYEAYDGGELQTVSYAQVAARATALARELTRVGGDGPVLLAYPAGIDYAVAVFGGFLAGRPVIPAFVLGRSTRDRDRLMGIVADARPEVVVAPEPDPRLQVPTTIVVPGDEADVTPWSAPRPALGGDVAVIQYTSGSTGNQRGVLVRHESLMANTSAIEERFGLNPTSRAVTWLPPFHDMGLVGGLLGPVAAGIPMRILTPERFVKAPLTWLREISDSGATVSGGPNFAYDLCVRRVRSEEQLDGLDLSRWRVAFNGGEPVRAQTLAAFARTFAPVGFRAEAFLPCYGLAEATLLVTGRHWEGADQLGEGEDLSCGPPVSGQKVAVIDPQKGLPVDPGDEGEIWISGPHITHGYLDGDASRLFGELNGVRHLRTGDLGRWRDGELIVTGRVKDVIIVRGVNYHAADIEAVALRHVGRSLRNAAAFAIENSGGTSSVLVLEVRGGLDGRAADAVRAAVLADTGLHLEAVVVVRPGDIPRTTSGKVRRSACRDLLASGAYVDAVRSGDPRLAEPPGPNSPTVADAVAVELTALIDGIALEICEMDHHPVGATLSDLGFDSVKAAEAAAVLEHALALDVPLESLLGAMTSGDIAMELLTLWSSEGIEPSRVQERIADIAAPVRTS